jgi:hypothetical protein
MTRPLLSMRCLTALALISACGLWGCATDTGGQAVQVNPPDHSDVPPAVRTWTPADQHTWSHVQFPGKKNTHFKLTRHQARDGLQADAQSSASMLRQVVQVPAEHLGKVKFSWFVPELIAGADMRSREASDSPVRLVLAFEGDRSQFSARNAMLSELARALTGEEMPYATLMYVWSNQSPVETVIPNSRTDRIQKVVVESGPHKLNQWVGYERNIRADFEKAFGEKPGALVAIGLMTDTDNTRTETRAWYGDIQLIAPD